MNIAVGYIHQESDATNVASQQRRLLADGCDTVRVESRLAFDPGLKPVLTLVCEFLSDGDELVAPDLTHLGRTPAAIAALVDRIEARGASVRFLDPAVSTRDEAGRTLIHALRQLAPQAVPSATATRRRGIDPQAIQALSAHGLGPSQIARRLGVSRMTVWRKLAAEARA